jgi:Ca-activated chloride channel family protein
MRTRLLLTLLLGACGGAADSGAPQGDDSPGNVGFGGAQDIGEFRGILDRGEIPGPTTLDANGFFNEHFNAPPATASCDGPVCLTPGLAIGRDFMIGQHQAVMQIALSTNIDPLAFPRLPMNLVVVVDHSGSMVQDGRLDKVKVGLHALIDNLGAEDRMALISFDDTVTINAPFGTDRDTLHATVDALRPDGGTNLYDGLEAGFRQLGDVPESEKQNRVIFLSDGLATAGNTSPQAIIEMSTGYITRGIGLTTIGVGTTFDVNVMRGLAENGAGNFYFVEDAAAATEVFTEELDFFMQPLAMDVRIEAAAAANWELRNVTGSKLWSQSTRQGSMAIPAVFFASRTSQSGEQGRRGGGSMIFIDLEPLANQAGAVAELTLSYRMPDSPERFTQRVTLSYDSNPQELLEQPHLSFTEMAERYAMYNVFLGLQRATAYAVDNYECAAAALRATRDNTRSWNSTHEDPDLAADLVLIDQFLANLQSKGITNERSIEQCPGAGEFPDEDWGNEGHYGRGMACSSGGGAGGWAALVLVFGILVRRRRRRA